ncbi:N-acetylmuramoyl-L-alanine amidase [Inhella sp.]|uniref:N-acetylmuramoyl-L-alanine amidase n=1 Tax=Inhella sp. TaxID=1921806 RepID=UPI0035ADB11F
MSTRRLLLLHGAFAWTWPLAARAATTPAAGADANLLAVRLWPAAAYTRVTLESDRPLAARHFVTEAPERLVIDIDGLSLSPRLKELVAKLQADDPFIASVRIGQYQPRVVRLVFDLKQGIAPQVFTLAPVAAYQHRLVLDLYPAPGAADPLLALLQERESNAKAAAEDINDALGEWIQKLPQDKASSPAPAPVPAPAASGPAAPAPAPAASAPPPPSSRKPRVERLVVVALDPGHGGEDPGAIGPTGLREKDVVLAVAKQLRERLLQEPNVRVLMTRDADYFVPLHERVRKARRVGADLFVSIHADAFIRPQARGASVFALADKAATSAAARWLAEKENAADAVGGLNQLAVKDETVLRVMADMSTTAQIKDSLQLGSEVLGQIGKVGRLHKPRVEQAGFAVLKAPDVPSILVETAFISNPEEEAKLRDPEYQRELVQALAKGLLRYLGKRTPVARRSS